MNRILKRPMFRLGGSAEGITSGLDGPNINASRQGYATAGSVYEFDELDIEKNKQRLKELGIYENLSESGAKAEDVKKIGEAYAQGNTIENIDSDEEWTDVVGTGGTGINGVSTKFEGTDAAPPSKSALEQLYEEQIAMEKKNAYEDEGIKPGAPGSVSSMLMNFGLNLAGQPGGDLVGAIGRAGSPALQRFQQAKLAERLDKRKTEREMRRDALDRAVDIRTAQIEAAGEIGAAGDTRFAFEATQQRMEELQGRGDELDVTISELKSKTIRNPDEEKRLQKAIRDRKNNEELQVLITKNPPKDIIGLTILKQIENGLKDMADYYEYLDDPDAYRKKEIAAREESADGGRAGYDIGGEVIEDVSSVSENVNMGPTAPAETQQLTYDELRSRLPREISNDIISLLAMSKQALTDFANIQTQQDVDNFNRSYNVDLVLPQEG